MNFCPNCGAAAKGARFCPQCGITLTQAVPDQSIQPPQEAPVEVVPPVNLSKKDNTIFWFIFAALAGMGLMMVAFATSSSSAKTPTTSTDTTFTATAPREDGFLTIDCYCGDSYESAARIYQAMKNKDMAGVFGLMARGAAKRVSANDDVHVIMTEGPFSYVRLKSGFQLGERCYVPSAFIK